MVRLIIIRDIKQIGSDRRVILIGSIPGISHKHVPINIIKNI
jgi:hypothetical protein